MLGYRKLCALAAVAGCTVFTGSSVAATSAKPVPGRQAAGFSDCITPTIRSFTVDAYRGKDGWWRFSVRLAYDYTFSDSGGELDIFFFQMLQDYGFAYGPEDFGYVQGESPWPYPVHGLLKFTTGPIGWDASGPLQSVYVDLSADFCGVTETYTAVKQVSQPSGGGQQPGSGNSSGCPKYVVIGSRGSGVSSSSKDWGGGLGLPGQQFVRALQAVLGKSQVRAVYNPYPAVGIIPSLKEIAKALGVGVAGLAAKGHVVQQTLNGAGALLRQKHLGAYYDSVKEGGSKLRHMIDAAVSSPCAREGTSLILTGYSQGAQVTGDVYQTLNSYEREYVSGVVLFGDTHYNPNDTSDHFGLNDPNPKDRWTKNQGVLNKRPAFNDPKVWSFCHRGDSVCQGLGQIFHLFKYHDDYTQFNEPQLAARYFAAQG